MLIALIPAIAWGSIGLVSGKLGGSANQQTLGMTWGSTIQRMDEYPSNFNWNISTNHFNCGCYTNVAER